jgi:hypothetical protein
MAQSTSATVSGLVLDPSGKVIAGADIEMVNDVTGVRYPGATNGEGIYQIPDLPPGPYRLQVSKVGFKTLIKPDIMLNVQDALAINFTLPVGAASETVTIEGGASMINTESATVSTVIDRQFAENLPMNGRSFQTLIYLTPGVVVVPPNGADNGQFTVNGQRASSNYWMVDGVSANIGVGTGSTGNGLGGTVGSFNAMGGTNGLVSVDAMQEFRIQTSTFAPEFGRTPGGQIAIATRSGTNDFHGTLFDYLRNNAFDAENWFNGYTNNPPLPKAEERQNDFGGTLGGPLLRDKTFFFFSDEGLRLRLPEVALTNVPDLAARQAASPALLPYFNSYPLPNGPDDLQIGIAQFNKSLSNPSTLDAYSIRVDHGFNSRWNLFGRYNRSPSESDARGGGPGGYGALNSISAFQIATQTATLGATWTASPVMTNDARFNYSRVTSQSSIILDNYGGAIPLAAPPYPASYSNSNAAFAFGIYSLGVGYGFNAGTDVETIQHQFNVVDSLTRQVRTHALKFGIDFRRLSPQYLPAAYTQHADFNDVPSAETGTAASGYLATVHDTTVLFHNIGAYAQDTWRALPRLTVTYGVRWDVDVAPSSASGPSIPAMSGYNLNNPGTWSIAPAGTPPFRTTYGNFAPRLGAAWQLSQQPGRQTVVRAGGGVFYDLVSAETGTVLGSAYAPFGASTSFGGTFPFAAAEVAPLPIPPQGTLSDFIGFNPNLKLPYTLEWNTAIEQSLGSAQTITLTYVGASGHRLLQTTSFYFTSPPAVNPSLGLDNFIDNTARSSYNALELQFHRRLSHALEALASYTWSHSIDNGSASSYAAAGNRGVPSNPDANRGNSDFDIRHAVTGGMTFDLPAVHGGAFVHDMLTGWSTDTLLVARSAPPLDIVDVHFFELAGGDYTGIRPDVVPGEPFYLFGSRYPGDKALNPGAFKDPPSDPATGYPLRQGDLARNALRAFGATQWDLAVHRDFPIRESLRMQFRTEMFNAINHPNFGPPASEYGVGGFGVSTMTLNESLSSAAGQGTGGFSNLYQIGGPRSIQFALKFVF